MSCKIKAVLRMVCLGIAASGIMILGSQAVAAPKVGVNATVGIANMYLYRGLDASGTDALAAVSGSLSVDVEGVYFGAWGSSGWDDLGAEYDLFIGYGRTFGAFGFDVGA